MFYKLFKKYLEKYNAENNASNNAELNNELFVADHIEIMNTLNEPVTVRYAILDVSCEEEYLDPNKFIRIPIENLQRVSIFNEAIGASQIDFMQNSQFFSNNFGNMFITVEQFSRSEIEGAYWLIRPMDASEDNSYTKPWLATLKEQEESVFL